MKKTLLILFSLLISTQTYAQVKTGGGPEKEDGGRFKEVDSRDKVISEYVSKLSENDVKCPNGQKISNERDLMQIYLKLSLYKGAKATPVQCNEAKLYFQCMHKGTKKLSWQVSRLLQIETHLAEKYKIPKEEAVKMIKFFEDLEKVE